MGIYMMSKKMMELIPENTYYGFDDLMHDMIQLNYKVKLFEFDGYWLDMGKPDDYESYK